MKTIIAISGWKKSGKDTAAERLISNHGFRRIAFADPLKVNVADAFGVELADAHDQSKKELPILSMRVDPKDKFSKMISEFMVKEFRFADGATPETFMYENGNYYGTRGSGYPEPVYWTIRALCILEGSTKRTADSDYWVKQAVQKASYGPFPVGFQNKFVIADLRYKSELTALKESMNIVDTLITVRVNRFSTCESTDPSERDLDDAQFDVVINNLGTLEVFLEMVDAVANMEDQVETGVANV